MTNPTLHTAVAEPDGIQVDAMSDETLLTSLEWGGVNWPSSCRGGSCRTCIGKLRSGEVEYSIEWPGLTAEEKAEGYCLPCVAYPRSNIVVEQGW